MILKPGWDSRKYEIRNTKYEVRIGLISYFLFLISCFCHCFMQRFFQLATHSIQLARNRFHYVFIVFTFIETSTRYPDYEKPKYYPIPVEETQPVPEGSALKSFIIHPVKNPRLIKMIDLPIPVCRAFYGWVE